MIEFYTTAVVGPANISVKLSYCTSDPAAVIFDFYTNPGDSSDWLFSRDLLAEALKEDCSGHGDVVIDANSDFVWVTLSSEEGKGTARFDREDIEDFVGLVYDEIPANEDRYEVPDMFPEEWCA